MPMTLTYKTYSSGCDVGWEEHGGHCYLLSSDDADHDGAVTICDGHQATLMTIETQGEQTFIESFRRADIIYATDQA